jgi:uncharacterized glyoxalase superfamily protein PhnB
LQQRGLWLDNYYEIAWAGPEIPNAKDRLPNIFPEIVYDDAPAAVEWLARAFGFTLGELIPGPDGTIAHAELHYGPGTVMVKSATGEALWGSSPRHVGGISQSVFVAVEDPDAHHEKRRPPVPRS